MKKPLILLTCLLFMNLTCDKHNWGEIGVVSSDAVEKGCWLIISEEGVSYLPVNLKEEYKKNGLHVRFSYRLEKEMTSICMQGWIISIVKIRKM